MVEASPDFAIANIADLKVIKGEQPHDDDYGRWITRGTITFRGITVPERFVTDLASIPSIFHSWASPGSGPHRYGGLIHDYVYSSTLMPKADCDRLFRAVNQDMGASRLKSSIMYQAVRWFGKDAFNWNREQLVERGFYWRFA